jgi:hypothetical protein
LDKGLLYVSAKQQERSEIKECTENRPAKGRESATGLLRRKVEVGKKEKKKKRVSKANRRKVRGRRKGKERGHEKRWWQTRSLLYVQTSHTHGYEAGTERDAT